MSWRTVYKNKQYLSRKSEFEKNHSRRNTGSRSKVLRYKCKCSYCLNSKIRILKIHSNILRDNLIDIIKD